MKQRIFTLIGVMLTATAMPAKAAPLAVANPIATFATPVYVTGAPGASSSTLLFVVERSGVIKVLDNEVTEATPFLNISARVSSGGERGLLSVAFDPQYETNKLLYVAFTNLNGDVQVDEFQRRASNPKRADPTTRRRVLVVPHRGASNHNGGQLQFGPDGFLYISIGDGGSLTPRGAPARNLKSLLGKILRINPKLQGTQAYTIPADNPFVGTANRGEIYSYGLRNPWRFSFDGVRIAIADVGQSRQEEINFLTVPGAKGVNFGWPQYEGNLVFDNTQPGPGPAKFPMYVYSHSSGGCAVIGGYVARDPGIPAIRGKYLFGDLCTGRISVFTPNVQTQQAVDVQFTGITAVNLASFGVGPNKRIYITQTSGQLSRIAASP
jgi:glucose/arabinose dehydrogenase